ncbi:uncharacterized protein [Drosophila virilis]|uniref:uncharacterized protein n=1 Tax=Drosophila virilis TaxID=7244 RepID=UPI0038B2D94E
MAKMQAARSRMLPNIGGPKPGRRLLLARVVASVLLYAAPIWASAVASQKSLRRKMSIPYRLCALRTISGFRTVLDEAATVLAEMLPVDILAKEVEKIWMAQMATRHAVPMDVIRSERATSMATWQERWNTANMGR